MHQRNRGNGGIFHSNLVQMYQLVRVTPFWGGQQTFLPQTFDAGDNYIKNNEITLYAVWQVHDPPSTSTIVTLQNQSYKFDINVANPINESICIVTTYADDGKLIEMQIIPMTVGTSNIILTMKKNLSATNAKVMIWDKLNTMQPLCDPEIIPTLP